jgi:hypothetical protein
MDGNDSSDRRLLYDIDRKIARMEVMLQQLYDDRAKFVTKQEFDAIVEPMQKLLYGAVAVILVGILSALVGLVVL